MAFTLARWLKEMAAVTPRMRGVTRDALLDRYGDDLGVWATRENDRWSYGEGTADDAWIVLHALAHLGGYAEGEERHAAWVRAFDWKDADAWGELPAMMGLSWKDLRKGGWRLGNNEVSDLIARCNQLASERGIDERFFSLATHGDNYVIVMLSPAAAKACVDRKLLDLDLRSPAPFVGDPLWRVKALVSGENSDLLVVAGVAFLALPAFLIFRDPVFTVVPLLLAVVMLRQPLAKRVSWLRWLG